MSLGRNVLKIATSRLVSSVVLFATTPIVARMFTPEDFGVQQIFLSITRVLGVVACLRYELSIPLGRDDREASASFALSMIVSLVFSSIILMITPLAKSYVATWFKSPDLEIYLWLLPIAILIRSLHISLRYWASYKMRFGIIAWGGFAVAAIGALTPIGWYFIFGRSPAGLMMAILTGAATGVLIFLIMFLRGMVAGFGKGGLRSIAEVARRHRKFPIYDTWSGFINTVSRNIPTFFLGSYFPTKVVGYYSLGDRVIHLPLSLLGISISQVFYPTASKEYHQTGDTSRIARTTVLRLTQIGVFPIVLLGFCGAKLFGFIFGQEWVEAGIYAQILSIFLLSQFIAFPLTTVFNVKAHQDKGLIFNVSLASTRLMALLVASRMGNPRIAMGAYSITSFVIYTLTFAWLLNLSNVSIWWGFKTMLTYLAISAALLLPALFFIHSGYRMLTVLSSLVLGTMLYPVILYKMDRKMQVAISAVFRRAKSLSAKA